VDRAKRTRIEEAIGMIWAMSREGILAQVEVVEEAVAGLNAGRLDDALRGRAQFEAHKIAGSVGSFGFMEASALAREMELLFEGESSLERDGARLSGLVAQLRGELEQPVASATAGD
jgi:HPt (histidine-containing phosphotransfer) domain-containing protein